EEPSEYSDQPYIYTRALIEDGRDNLVMTGPIDTHCPVHILQGLDDPDVPPAHAMKLASLLPADDVTLSLIPQGDHRLSRPQDLEMLIGAVEAIVQRAGWCHRSSGPPRPRTSNVGPAELPLHPRLTAPARHHQLRPPAIHH